MNAVEIANAPIGKPADPLLPDPARSKRRRKGVAPQSDVNDREAGTASWMTQLPKVSSQLLASSLVVERLPGQLPPELSAAIEAALAEILFAEATPVSYKLRSICERDLSVEASEAQRIGDLAIQFRLEPAGSRAALLIGASFVHRTIDKFFGSSGLERSNRVSPIELAIVEFLSARVVSRVNDGLGREVFSLAEASMAHAGLFAQDEAGISALIDVDTADGTSQSFQLLVTRGMLSGLRESFDLDSEANESVAERLLRTVRLVPLKAQIGSTRLDASTMRYLEPGDVVVIERSYLDWINALPSGEIRLIAGAGDAFIITGDIVTDDVAARPGLRVQIKDISTREAVGSRFKGRLNMEDQVHAKPGKESGEDSPSPNTAASVVEGGISASVENLQLRLRVELAGVNVSLREIGNLHPGQVIDLGRGPTDPVDLITDGSDERVAVGELVDIDGRLGVKLTKVFI